MRRSASARTSGAPSRVDEKSGRFHQRKFARSDQVMRLGLERGMYRYEVRLGQEPVQRDVVETEFPLVTLGNPPRAPVEDPHLEPACSPRPRTADACTATDEPKGLAPDERS